jgi:mono/diheme cytochrome c family protein
MSMKALMFLQKTSQAIRSKAGSEFFHSQSFEIYFWPDDRAKARSRNYPATCRLPSKYASAAQSLGGTLVPEARTRRFITMLGIGAVAVIGLLDFQSSARAETLVERGAYLVNGIGTCGNCHSSPREGELPSADLPLSGGQAITAPIFTAYPPNITPGNVNGIGGWSEDQIVTVLREGKRPDGRMIRPPMPIPFTRRLSDQDAYAVAAYLKSTPPVSNEVPDSYYKVPTPASYGPPVASQEAPPRTDKVAYGGYLAQVAHCVECHTPLTAQGAPDPNLLGSGGRILEGAFGRRTSRNITQDKETGIGAWTDKQIRNALTKGERPDGSLLSRPMPFYFYKNVSAEDIDSVIAWLRTVKPVKNLVEN